MENFWSKPGANLSDSKTSRSDARRGYFFSFKNSLALK